MEENSDISVGDVIGERAKRARRYLVIFMKTRDIYMGTIF